MSNRVTMEVLEKGATRLMQEGKSFEEVSQALDNLTTRFLRGCGLNPGGFAKGEVQKGRRLVLIPMGGAVRNKGTY